jgi:hypothetical protein
MTEVKNAHGHPILQVLVSIKTIEKDDMLCFNYLTHPIKKGRYVELASERVNNFIANYGSLKEAIDYIAEELQTGSQERNGKIIANFLSGSNNNGASTSNKFMSTEDILAPEAKFVFENIVYILGTNSVLIRLALEGYVKKNDLKLVRDAKGLKWLSERTNEINRDASFFAGFGQSLIDFLEVLETTHESKRKILIDFLLNEKCQDSTALKVLFIINFVAYAKQYSFEGIEQFYFKKTLEGLWFQIWSELCQSKQKEESSWWSFISSWFSFKRDSKEIPIPSVDDIFDCAGYRAFKIKTKDL